VSLAASVGALAALTLGFCGCTTLSEYVHNGFKVGPNYARPPVPLTPGWIDENNRRVHVGDPNLATWWEVFDDPQLNELIRQSMSQNLTLRAAMFQILQAQDARAIAVGELFPQSQAWGIAYSRVMTSKNQGSSVGFGGSAGAGLAPNATLSAVPLGSTTPIAGVTPGTAPGTTTTAVGVAVPSSIGGATNAPGASAGVGNHFTNIATSLNASWELDFWGLFRRNLESANASLDQSVFNYDQAVVLLLANVATQYVDIRTLQKRLVLARQNVAQQQRLVDFLEKRLKEGLANSIPAYNQLKSNLDNTKALIPPLEAALRQANNQLCVLLGIPVQDLIPELGDGTVVDPAAPKRRVVHIPGPRSEDVVVGIPGALLLRRPDVQASEAELRIQSAQIGIAEAEMLPHIGINGAIGLASRSFADLFAPHSWTGSIGPSLTWNILNYGRLLSAVRFQNDQYQQFVAQYQNTLLNANQDAENALVAYLQSLDQARHLQDSADAAVKASNVYEKMFNEGFLPQTALDSGAFFNLLFTTLNFQVQQQDAAAQAQGNIALNLILLYRAMGGGWQLARPQLGHGHGARAGCLLPPVLPQELPAPPRVSDEMLPAPKAMPPIEPKPEPGAAQEKDQRERVLSLPDRRESVLMPAPPTAADAAQQAPH
jgi:NodT family efflux transporter outer membrane factor (OMF) lipoprotein